MAGGAVPAFSPAVLQYLKRVGDASLLLDAAQLAELPPNLAMDLKAQHELVGDAATMGRLLGKHVDPSPSKVDMKSLLQYFSNETLDAESPLTSNSLDAPLSNYFINSSHNTYLTGNQLYGTASTEAYKNALRRGCRSIEIDVWDGKATDQDKPEPTDRAGANGVDRLEDKAAEEQRLQTEPRVLHGHTLTKEVSFRAVCRAIGESAFETSDLPVVVSLEVHAHAEQQEMMVQIMNQTWHGMLVEPPAEECTSLPSPNDLRRKILVKVKGKALGKPEELLPMLERSKTEDSPSSSDEEEKASKAGKAKPKPSKIIDSLSSLGIYTRSYHFKQLDSPEACLPTHIFSLSERKVMSVHENESSALFKHNCQFLMRAFPAGTRVTSTNLDPAVFWRKGIQMVALNFQKFDAGVMQNHAMFAGSGGWVLKPDGYRSTGNFTQSGSGGAGLVARATIERYSLELAIRVMAIQDLPPAKHPYVKCELHVETTQERKGEKIEGGGHSKDGEYKRRTKVAKTLDFGGERLDFPTLLELVPSLTFIRFKVMDDVLGPDELVAWGCIRLDRLRAGIRFLHLLDSHGQATNGVVLLEIEKKLSPS